MVTHCKALRSSMGWLWLATLVLAAITLLQSTALAKDTEPPASTTPPPGVTIQAKVASAKLVVGDVFRYEVNIQGNAVEQQIDTPSFSQVPGLELVGGPNLSQGFEMINGRSSMWRTNIYTLRVTKTGEITIPPTRLRINNRWYETNSVTLQVDDVPKLGSGLDNVISGRSNSPEVNRELHGNYFALAEIPEVVYRGQPVPVTVYIYRSPNLITFSQWERVRDLAGTDFVVPTTQESLQNSRVDWKPVEIGGREMLRTALYTTFVVPTRSGELLLTPPLVRVYLAPQTRGSRRIEDLMFPTATMIPVDLEIRTMRVNVLAPPEPPAEAILQTIGDMTARVRIDRQDPVANKAEVPQRELLTVILTLGGEGFFDMVVPPNLPSMAGLVPVDRKTSTRARIEGGRYLSEKTFEYILQATQPGETVLPELTFAIFNPRTGQQETVRSEAIPIRITAAGGESILIGAGAAAVGPAARAGARVLGGDVAYIDASPLTAANIAAVRLFYTQPWFWLAQAFIWFSALGWGGWRLWLATRGEETPEARILRVRREASQAIAKAEGMIGVPERNEFYRILSASVLQFVATRLGLSAKGLTIDEAVEGLRAQGIPSEALTKLNGLLQRCDSIRYSPAPDTEEARRAACQEAREVLIALDGGSEGRT